MPPVPFPRSSTPGRRPGEGEGRLLNAFVEKDGDTVYWRRVPGLAAFATGLPSGSPRGLLDVSGTIVAVVGTAVVKINSGGTVTTLTGTISGSDGVTLARNNRTTAGGPDIVAVREGGGAYSIDISGNAASAFADADLPATVNSVAFLDGFFLFSIPDGRIFASGLNDVTIDPLSFATAESKPDGLKRGIVSGARYFAMGTNTIEPWINNGDTPFPLIRHTTVIPVGLLTTMAVAGFEEGWDRNPIFVAHDGTVRELVGYRAEVVSTPDVEAFIAASQVDALQACVYTARGNAFWALTSDQGTWEYNATTKQWHERASTGVTGWRGSRSVKSNGYWHVGDRAGTNLLRVSDTVVSENGGAIEWRVESSAMKGFPARIAIPAAYMDFTEAATTVDVSYSHDGGKTYSTPDSRTLTDAETSPVLVRRLGMSTQHGLRLRLSNTSTVDFSFLGASVPDAQARAA